MNQYLLFFAFACLFVFSKHTKAQVIINEFMASNATSMDDFNNNSEFADWIELFNTSNEAIDLSNFTLTDNFSNPQKWSFPAGTVIEANGYLKIYADGDGDQDAGFPFLNTNFKLSKEGEEIALVNSFGEFVDSIRYPFQYTDISYGRYPNGSENWMYFGESTSKAENIYPGIQTVEYAKAPEFSIKGGFFSEEQVVSISSSENAEIRYTTDCKKPSLEALLFDDDLLIDSIVIVKARCYMPGKAPSTIVTQTYFVSDTVHDLPVISLSAYPDVLWKTGAGIYRYSRKGKEVPANFEFFEYDKDQKISQILDIRLSGQASYQAPQKPFTLSAKGKYGNDIIEYPFFSNRSYNQFNDIYLRTSGTPDNYVTMFRDGLTHSLAINNTNVDCQAYRPAVLYLNGEYWGIYNIREKQNADYLNNLHQVNPDNLTFLENESNVIIVHEGSDEEMQSIISLLEENPNYLKNPMHYEYFTTIIDIDEIIDYQITEIYIDNVDWVDRNIKFWKENVFGGKWRWLMLDTDVSYGMHWLSESDYFHNNLFNALSDSNTPSLIMRSLIKNPDFQQRFIGRFAALLNTIFSEERAYATLDSLKQGIYSEMPRQIERWVDHPFPHYGPTIQDMEDWLNKVAVMENFALARPNYQRQHIVNYFDLPGMDTLKLNVLNASNGKIYINDVFITDNSANGLYFNDVIMQIKAEPKVGFVFSRWQGALNSVQPIISLSVDSLMNLEAVFEPDSAPILPDTIYADFTLLQQLSPYKAKSDLVIMPNATLTIEQGVTLFMPEKASIYVYGQINCNGTADDPIVIDALFAEEKKWGALCFENATSPSILNHLDFRNASQSRNYIDHFSSISAYHSDITLNFVDLNSEQQCFYSEGGTINIQNGNFHSAVSGDLINIKYADSAIVAYCNLKGSFAYDADAIDFDGFSDGIIRGNTISAFNGFNSDGIDIGEEAQNVLIEDNVIYNCFDKGISVGQASSVKVQNNVIAYCDQGIGIKDFDSFADIDKNTFYSNNKGVACFEKNYGAGGGGAEIANSIFASSPLYSVYVDQYSQATISYSLSDTDTLLGESNLYASPQFVNDLLFNFALAEGSPAIDAGNPESPLDDDGSICDMGASFSQTQGPIFPIVINEVNYNSPMEFDTGDWIELANVSDSAIDLSSWVFMDSENDHLYSFPDGVKIQANDYMVVFGNDSSFRSRNPLLTKVFGVFNFGLSSAGEMLRLFNAKMELVDYVIYNVNSPWPNSPNGEGPSLELVNEALDNTLAENWRPSPYLGGSPGVDNNYIADATFEHQIISECTGEVSFEYISHGIYDSLLWSFGDGNTSYDPFPLHTYNAPGDYEVTLRVYNYFGSDVHTEVVSLPNVLIAPLAMNDTVCDKGEVTINAFSDHEVYWYEYESYTVPFHIGNSYTDMYYSSKTYYLSSVEDENCESARVPVRVQVNIDPRAHFIYSESMGNVSFTNYSSFSNVYHWDFGDGEQSNAFEPEHVYDANGEYIVRLIAEDTFCERRDTKEIAITIDSLAVGLNLASQSKGFSVYPNPTQEKLYLFNRAQYNNEIAIEIYSVLGTKMYADVLLKPETIAIDVSKYEPGIYWISIMYNEELEVLPFVVE